MDQGKDTLSNSLSAVTWEQVFQQLKENRVILNG